MKNKIIIALIIILALMTVSVVSASENATDDALAQNVASDGEPLIQDDADPDGNGSVPKANSTLESSDAVGYESFSATVNVKLTAEGVPLAGKIVNITVNNKSYERTTNSNGQATLKITLSKGNYLIKFDYGGDENTTSAFTTSRIVIKSPTTTSIKVADAYINYRQGLKNSFIVRLVDANGRAIANQVVTVKVNGKTYTAKTDKNGYAEVHLNLRKGNYVVRFYFYKNAPYLQSSGYFKINVKAPMAKGNGYWLWPKHMKSLNLKLLSQRGTKHIFLHVQAFSSYGKSAVMSFIKKAHRYGIKVHIWVQVCYNNDKWVSPVNKDGSFKYKFINSKIAQAVKYAKMPGVDGIHFDYIRFGGTAHKYSTATKAINYITKKASYLIHKAKPNCIVSAAVMPEVSMMEYWYGQDVSTMGRYLDVIVPMVYKGNFNQKSPWIGKVVSIYKQKSKSAVIWAGLQSYHSDNNVKKLSVSDLMKDARSAKSGGATGSILFRVGLTYYLNFKRV